MEGGTIARNRTTRVGGAGVSLNINAGGTFIMRDGMIGGLTPAEGNIATGVGGGVATQANTTFIMEGGTISYNQAGTNAGGVFVSGVDALFTMHEGIISRNRAQASGGGLWVGNTANFDLTGTGVKTITHNTATTGDGGGAWVAANAFLTMLPGTTGASFTNNTAVGTVVAGEQIGGMGGAIFTDHYQYSSPLTISTPTNVYTNLTILPGTVFSGNLSYQYYAPPANAVAWTGIPNMPNSTTFAHPINNHDINFRTTTVEFIFYKTNHHIYNDPQWNTPGWIESTLLPGATFRLYRFTGSGAPPAMVTDAGILAGDWTFAGEASSGNAANQPIAIEFDLIIGSVYNLIETVAPPGFTLPLGQWRIEPVVAANDDVGFRITAMGDPGIPAFVNIGGSTNPAYPNVFFDGTFYVGNRPIPTLPLMGGAGATIFFIFGTVLLLGALSLVVHRSVRRRRGAVLTPVG